MARTAAELMWVEALAEVARADRLHREFFCPASRGWEPPIDLLETSEGLIPSPRCLACVQPTSTS